MNEVGYFNGLVRKNNRNGNNFNGQFLSNYSFKDNNQPVYL
jgi:hypothetical protein